MIIQYLYGEADKTFEVDLPERVYLRHNPLTKVALAATLTMEEYAEDPNDMYEYSDFETAEYHLASFWLCKKYDILDEQDFNNEYQEITTEYLFEVLIEDGQHVVNIIDIKPTAPLETSET